VAYFMCQRVSWQTCQNGWPSGRNSNRASRKYELETSLLELTCLLSEKVAVAA
jgi:hypothetical protein